MGAGRGGSGVRLTMSALLCLRCRRTRLFSSAALSRSRGGLRRALLSPRSCRCPPLGALASSDGAESPSAWLSPLPALSLLRSCPRCRPLQVYHQRGRAPPQPADATLSVDGWIKFRRDSLPLRLADHPAPPGLHTSGLIVLSFSRSAAAPPPHAAPTPTPRLPLLLLLQSAKADGGPTHRRPARAGQSDEAQD